MKFLAKRLRFNTRTLLVVTCAIALSVQFIVVPDVKRTRAIKQLRGSGVIIRAPIVVMYEGQHRVTDFAPEPAWFAFRQKINNFIGVETVPWHSEGFLEIETTFDSSTKNLIEECRDLDVMPRGTLDFDLPSG